jgi:hypothetical protein
MTATTRPADDPLDDPAVWRGLIRGFANAPMNYGTDVGAVRPLALAAGIEPGRAIARVLTYWHRHDTLN